MNVNKMKGFAESAAFLLIFSACILIGIGSAAATATVTVDDSAAQALSPGDTFDVVVTLDSDGSIVSTLGVELMYDSTVLDVVSITQNGLFGATANVDYIPDPANGDDDAGTIYYALSGTTAEAKNGDFITVEFTVLPAVADGAYPLELSMVDLLYGATEVPYSAVDGTATVGDEVVEDEYPEVYVSPSTTNVDAGDTFEVKIKLDSMGEDVSTMEISLAYDSDALTVLGITQNGLFGAVENVDYIVVPGSGDDGSGLIMYGLAGTISEPKVGDFITIEFEAASTADGSYSLDLMDVELLDGSNEVPDVIVTGGSVDVTTVPAIPPIADITSHTSGETLSQIEIISVEDDSGDDDVVSATFEIFADLDGDCNADDVGEDWSVLGVDTNGTDGWSVVFDSTTVPDGNYLIKATIDDGQDTSFEIICVTVYNPAGILLKPGWNFISVPEALENPAVADVLTDFDSTVIDAVFYDDLSSGVNTMVIPTEFEPLKGYWIHNAMDEDVIILETYIQKSTTVPATPATLQLYPGWNAIGHTALEAQSADIALMAIGDDCLKVMGPWVPSANNYAYIGLNIEDGSSLTGNFVTIYDFQMDAYEGFYVLVQEECLLG
ncbi:cohesin domain-containing protein [Methanolobus tindarius DSM 2278]|uniref:Cohesin domain-containing protein n=1 Tax=Methanolobus tindarius DSM 2278 TaxID=1090322 RepID=W9E0M7_METTI|nr:cohesin domain-containing protein [Methanolobus tindarius]ETA69166.1 cohesin domain-containing protein [Methanolobus tindarius DSM 2278]